MENSKIQKIQIECECGSHFHKNEIVASQNWINEAIFM